MQGSLLPGRSSWYKISENLGFLTLDYSSEDPCARGSPSAQHSQDCMWFAICGQAISRSYMLCAQYLDDYAASALTISREIDSTELADSGNPCAGTCYMSMLQPATALQGATGCERCWI